ncbi:MAG: endonuclease III, partial [Clostridia bacterium]|nr:endonuclease III [Clostridia bacterium]
GHVPDSMDSLLTLPGVGRKTANLVLGDIYGKDAVVCDTHFICIMARFGMYALNLKDATKIEYIIRELTDVSDGSEFCHRIVTFGREYCTALSPRCAECPLSDICPKIGVKGRE